MYRKYLFHICLGTLLCFSFLLSIILADNNSKCYIVLYNKTESNINNVKIHHSEEIVPIEISEIKSKEQYSLTISLPSHISDNKLILSYSDANDKEHECEFKGNSKVHKYIEINLADENSITMK